MGPDDATDAVADAPGWQAGLGDMDEVTFRAAAHRIVDIVADYLDTVEDRPVLPSVEPGSIARLFPAHAPHDGEPIDAILTDYRALVEPNANNWVHPAFMAWFPSSSAAPGVLGEFLMAGLAQNTFLWRTSPVGAELEAVVVGWLREALGLPDAFDGFFTDTASTSSLIALGAAREAAGLDAAARGLGGRHDIRAPRIYASTEAHSSIDKAAMTLGVGRANLVHIPTDDAFALRPDALGEAIAADRAAGHQPMAIVATLGTTNTSAIDPAAAIADIAEREGLWLHVDAAYGGSAALVPELRDLFAGWERADSIVVNPHKWMAVPFDASLLLTRRMPDLRTAFSHVPEYLRGPHDAATRNISEFTPQLGRRFRALKVWVFLRAFGVDGLRRRIRWHVAMAQELAARIDAHPDWEVVAPVPLSTICVRWRPSSTDGDIGAAPDDAALDGANEAIIEAVNATGEVLLSHTKLDGRFTIRIALGHIRGEQRHADRAWELLQAAAEGRLGQGTAIGGKSAL